MNIPPPAAARWKPTPLSIKLCRNISPRSARLSVPAESKWNSARLLQGAAIARNVLAGHRPLHVHRAPVHAVGLHDAGAREVRGIFALYGDIAARSGTAPLLRTLDVQIHFRGRTIHESGSARVRGRTASARD